MIVSHPGLDSLQRRSWDGRVRPPRWLPQDGGDAAEARRRRAADHPDFGRPSFATIDHGPAGGRAAQRSGVVVASSPTCTRESGHARQCPGTGILRHALGKACLRRRKSARSPRSPEFFRPGARARKGRENHLQACRSIDTAPSPLPPCAPSLIRRARCDI